RRCRPARPARILLCHGRFVFCRKRVAMSKRDRSSAAETLPIVDLSRIGDGPAARRAIARTLGRAARDIGFFYIVGHGIPSSLIDAVFDQSAAFFALPEPEKLEQSITRSRHIRGYVAMKGESLDPSKPPDLKEAFNIGLDLSPGD